MKKYVFIFLIVCSFKSVYSQLRGNELKITYIANEGFLLSSSNKNVLIDALFTDGYGLFSTPSKEVIDKIMESKPPFDKIDSYFLTHYHKDHCDPELLNNYLAKNKNIPLITTKPSIVFINGNCFNFILLKKQFYELTPENNQSVSKIVNNIPVKAFGLKHLSFYNGDIDMEENMFNAAFLFEIDGIKIFHSGDIKKDALQNYLSINKKWTDSIDVAFLYFELFESGLPDLDFIMKTLNPKYIVLMHVPPGDVNEWTLKVDQLKTNNQNIILFKNSMDSQIIDIPE